MTGIIGDNVIEGATAFTFRREGYQTLEKTHNPCEKPCALLLDLIAGKK